MSKYCASFVVKESGVPVLKAALDQDKVDKQDESRVEAAFASVKIAGNQAGNLTAVFRITKDGKKVNPDQKVKCGLAEALQAEAMMLRAAEALRKGTAARHGL